MLSFKDWMLQKESSPATRARSAAARGLMPLAVVGSIHGHSTANPWEAEQLAKLSKKHKKSKKKRFGASLNKKKITISNKNSGIDSYVKEVGELKDALTKLEDIFDSKAKNPKAKKPLSDKKNQDSEKNIKDDLKQDKDKKDKELDEKDTEETKEVPKKTRLKQ